MHRSFRDGDSPAAGKAAIAGTGICDRADAPHARPPDSSALHLLSTVTQLTPGKP